MQSTDAEELTIVKYSNDQNHERGEVEFPYQRNQHKPKLQRFEVGIVTDIKHPKNQMHKIMVQYLRQYGW